jgi:ribosomal protein S21
MAEPMTEEDLIYRAWRDSESYQVPMTKEGEEKAQARFYAFKKGWAYAK